MKNWKSLTFRGRLLVVIAIILALSLAFHPELRLLTPFLDAAGLDVLLTLLSAQIVVFVSGTCRPALVWLQMRGQELAGRALGLLSELLFGMSGYLGQYVWVKLRLAQDAEILCRSDC